ncbi:inner membrane CreD family protein [Alysiella filiformis]|uniref:Inner membrane protein n=1 Tax=Alysiella filiformis DSM 16848 TaxID=1120981 RepID=A0A286E5J1_9NEIS|nr:inner membrane CreD family protein [Alysiella filiformis]QMT30376.1 inner membrane CreD family protein [Alysiella filiformis]UBQ56644.1 cell envelope integrity protein CreD [Alysiella filiformis DSM 16848]SOD66163.1 inner membrane protein [Alysiella filiformis DSM 16848]
MSKKLWHFLALCVVFSLVLMLINNLAEQRLSYHSSPLLGEMDYRMIIRSMKYGMLLVIMVFSVFFLSEILQDWHIHPIQYLLVGAALSLFYLLLLSFAEHIGFVAAYVLGAVACIGLLWWYLQYVLASQKGVHLMAGLLIVSYATMFVLLRLQEYNLVVGSCLLFATLFGVMYFTRHINWYELEQKYHDDEKTTTKKSIS